MITHDLYQTSVYLGMPVWTLSFTAGTEVIVEGPFCVCATDYFSAGAESTDYHNAGAVATQGDCC